MITPLHASILGLVEGLTEFLPVSSTGHMILTAHWLGLNEKNAGLDAFEVVIQSGALLAVIGLYMRSIVSMLRGIAGKDPQGRALLTQLIVAFMPAAVIGLLAEKAIKAHLFGATPVVISLAVGGIAMIVVERRRARQEGRLGAEQGLPLAAMTLQAALVIGFAQCIAMWPGTSRSMVTIIAALLLGYNVRAAAEFSFLLALPTLGAATAHDLLKHHHDIMQAAGGVGLALGFLVSFVVAWVAVKWFIGFLTRNGMAMFGWYRIALAAVVAIFLWGI